MVWSYPAHRFMGDALYPQLCVTKWHAVMEQVDWILLLQCRLQSQRPKHPKCVCPA